MLGFKTRRSFGPGFAQCSRGSVRIFASADEKREFEPNRIGDNCGVTLG